MSKSKSYVYAVVLSTYFDNICTKKSTDPTDVGFYSRDLVAIFRSEADTVKFLQEAEKKHGFKVIAGTQSAVRESTDIGDRAGKYQVLSYKRYEIGATDYEFDMKLNGFDCVPRQEDPTRFFLEDYLGNVQMQLWEAAQLFAFEDADTFYRDYIETQKIESHGKGAHKYVTLADIWKYLDTLSETEWRAAMRGLDRFVNRYKDALNEGDSISSLPIPHSAWCYAEMTFDTKELADIFQVSVSQFHRWRILGYLEPMEAELVRKRDGYHYAAPDICEFLNSIHGRKYRPLWLRYMSELEVVNVGREEG